MSNKLYKNVNIIKNKLKINKLTIGSWIQLNSVASTILMTEKKIFDWLTLDMEHGEINFEDAIKLINLIQSKDIPCFIRLRESNTENIKYSLECGALGLIYPNMSSYDEVKNKIEYSIYNKKRGVGFSLSNSFGIHLKKNLNFNPINIVMVENTEIVEDLDKLKSIKEIDAFLIGPYDLRNSFIKKNQESKFKSYLNKIFRKLKKNNMRYGIHIVNPNKKILKENVRKGSTFIPLGMDTVFLRDGISKI